MNRGFIPFFMLILALPFPTFAEEDLPSPPILSSQQAEQLEEEVLYLREETVSIATRHEQPISQAPSEVFVITDEDIRQSGAIDLPTVLRRVPGMEVMQISGAQFDVSMRGDNQLVANKLLVMVDGRSVYIDSQGEVLWKLIPVTLPEIKRIEVLKGPASVLYGFNAFDGIINIITKSAEEMKGTTLQFGGGEFGTITSSAIHAGKVGGLGYRLSAGHDQNQQWRNRDALAFRANKFNVQTDYTFSDDARLLISGGLVDSNRYDGSVVGSGVFAQTPALSYTHATYERPNFFIRAFWNGYNDTIALNTNPLLTQFLRTVTRGSSPTTEDRSNTYNIEAQHAVELGFLGRFTYGLNYRLNTLNSGLLDQSPRNENRVGLYVQEEWNATRELILTAGARYDMDTFIHPTISPRVTLLYRPVPDHSVRATFSIAYRPPTLFETYSAATALVTLPPPLPSPPPLNFGPSPNLKPEHIISYDIGYQGWYLRHRLRLRADLFFNHITDLTQLRSVGPIQSGEADIYGGEAGLEFLVTKWLSGFANYSYQEINQTFTGDAQRGAPRFKWNVGLRGEWENGLSSEILYHYYGAATYPVNQAFFTFAPFGVPTPNPRVGSYNLLNLRGAYKFWKQEASAGYLREAEVAVSAFNALDDKHKEHPLGDTIGSRVMGWLTVRY